MTRPDLSKCAFSAFEGTLSSSFSTITISFVTNIETWGSSCSTVSCSSKIGSSVVKGCGESSLKFVKGTATGTISVLWKWWPWSRTWVRIWVTCRMKRSQPYWSPSCSCACCHCWWWLCLRDTARSGSTGSSSRCCALLRGCSGFLGSAHHLYQLGYTADCSLCNIPYLLCAVVLVHLCRPIELSSHLQPSVCLFNDLGPRGDNWREN